MQKIKLTFPKTHEMEDLAPLFEEFCDLYPEECKKWRNMEETKDFQPKDLVPVQQMIFDFLKKRTNSEYSALISAWVDFRGLMYRSLQDN